MSKITPKAVFEILREKDTIYFIVAVSLAVAACHDMLRSASHLDHNKLRIILFAACFVFLIAVIMIRFLTGSSRVVEIKSKHTSTIRSLEYMKKLEDEISLNSYGLSDNAKNTLLSKLHEKVKTETAEAVINEIREQLREDELSVFLNNKSRLTLERIYKEIDALNRRGSLNLVLGMLAAVSGIGLLFYLVFNENTHDLRFSEFMMHFLPRLSIIAIIELFSYFFLRLYKSSLSEIKYFQNEATNIECMFLALESSFRTKSSDLINSSIQSILKTERNPIFSMQMTNRELEDAKLFQTPTKLTLGEIGELTKAWFKDDKSKQ